MKKKKDYRNPKFLISKYSKNLKNWFDPELILIFKITCMYLTLILSVLKNSKFKMLKKNISKVDIWIKNPKKKLKKKLLKIIIFNIIMFYFVDHKFWWYGEKDYFSAYSLSTIKVDIFSFLPLYLSPRHKVKWVLKFVSLSNLSISPIKNLRLPDFPITNLKMSYFAKKPIYICYFLFIKI